jgi:hypothetical protein
MLIKIYRHEWNIDTYLKTELNYPFYVENYERLMEKKTKMLHQFAKERAEHYLLKQREAKEHKKTQSQKQMNESLLETLESKIEETEQKWEELKIDLQRKVSFYQWEAKKEIQNSTQLTVQSELIT